MKINSLTGTRAIAAITVVIFHYGGGMRPFSLFGNLFRNGNIMVGYFFVLSGFVLFISHAKVNYFTFIKKRLARIAPAYFTALIMTAAIIYFYYPMSPAFYWNLLYDTLFIHSFFPEYTLRFNSPSWSVSVEMIFYLLFPLLLLLTNYRKIFITLTCTIYITTQIIHLRYCNTVDPLTGSGIFFNPFMHLNQFMVGMAGGLIYKHNLHFFRHRLLPLLFLTITIVLILIKPDYISYQAGLIAPVFMLLIISIAVNSVQWLSSGIAVFLGEISYGIYIYQYPIFKYLHLLNDHYAHYTPPVAFYMCFAALIIISTLSYYIIEKPIIGLFRTRSQSKAITGQ